ncbi:threonine and homoserine efflux system [Roseovarius albus]|uniref:Threonine and homoserine efflux system n=1 Tax=Roseovarius albus TaxID=1247867 RepID=A0A1X6ZTC4_9RHOB|nr:DMT family transporter [Roseovarius albus]SLN60868.1 threonine and homoserine efflux system [Roseovarius albus]
MTRGLLLGFAAAFLWGTHSVIVQFLTGDLDAIQIAAMRLYIAATTLFIVLKVLRQPISIPKHSKYFWLATGATFVNYILFHLGLERTTAASAMVLENTAPFFALLFLFVFFRTPVSWLEVGATVLAVVGVALIVYPDLAQGGARLTGDIMEVGAGITWAVFLIASSLAMQASQSTGERLNFLFGIFSVTAVLLTPIALINMSVPTAGDILPLSMLGILATALSYYFWYEAAAVLSTMTATLLFALSVVVTFMNAAIFLHESIVLLQAVGATMIVAGIFLTTQAKKRVD